MMPVMHFDAILHIAAAFDMLHLAHRNVIAAHYHHHRLAAELAHHARRNDATL